MSSGLSLRMNLPAGQTVPRSIPPFQGTWFSGIVSLYKGVEHEHRYIQFKCFGLSYDIIDICSVHFVTISRKQAGLRFLSYIFLHDISVIYLTLGYTQFMVVEEFESSSWSSSRVLDQRHVPLLAPLIRYVTELKVAIRSDVERKGKGFPESCQDFGRFSSRWRKAFV